MKRSRSLLTAACVLLLMCCGSVAFAQAKPDSGPAPKMDERSGVAVGEKVPAFRLKDQNGRERSLEDLLAKGNVALVFYRSADW